MVLLIGLISTLLLLFELALVARAVLDLTAVLATPSMPGTFRWRAGRLLWRATEPVLAPVRRAVPPLQIGRTRIDLAFGLVFFGIMLLRTALNFLA